MTYQVCPLCKGVPSSFGWTCQVCKGRLIIHEETGLPPGKPEHLTAREAAEKQKQEYMGDASKYLQGGFFKEKL